MPNAHALGGAAIVSIVGTLVVLVLALVLALRYSVHVRNLLGIRKDLLETKKAKRELEKMDSQIQPATLGDVRKYDAKSRKLLSKVAELMLLVGFFAVAAVGVPSPPPPYYVLVILALAILALVFGFCMLFLKKQLPTLI